MKLEVNIEKGPALLIIGSLLLVGGLFFVQGYNPSGLGGTPSMMGHSVDEIDWTQSLPSLIVDGGVNAFTDPGFFAFDSTYGFGSYFGSMQTSSFSVSMPKIFFYGPFIDGVLTDTDVEITGNLAVTGSITSGSDLVTGIDSPLIFPISNSASDIKIVMAVIDSSFSENCNTQCGQSYPGSGCLGAFRLSTTSSVGCTGSATASNPNICVCLDMG
jgi:hypothetical protein